MSSGIVSVSSFQVTSDSINLDQIEDVVITTQTHQNVIRFNDSIIDPSYNDGFVNKTFNLETTDDVNSAAVPDHNSLLSFNDNIVEPSIVDGWTDKSSTDIIVGLQITIEGLVNIELSTSRGQQGNPALSDLVAFTEVDESGFNMAISSCGDNNVVFKRELTDEDFVFLQVLSKGEILNLSLSAGTVFRSSKGLTGITSVFPTPMGVSSINSNYFRLYSLRHNGFVSAASGGLEAVVTLFASNGTTIVDGPTTIAPYSSVTLACNGNAEYVLESTTNVYCAIFAIHTTTGLTIDQRLQPPPQNELIVWNRRCNVTAQDTGTLVRWYRRNGETGIFTVNSGTPLDISTGTINEEAGPANCGDNPDYAPDGCLILRADKRISAFSGADSAGFEATPAWPLSQTAQLFANPATIDSNTDPGFSSVTIASQFEGECQVYDSTGTLLETFTMTRSVSPATTADEQLYPASGQWRPFDTAGVTLWTGGWVQTNVPSICIFNFNGDVLFTDYLGDEFLCPGVTPTEIRAEIAKDANGLYRRRDVSATGVETWNVC